jgi:uncharacterized protein YkwD
MPRTDLAVKAIRDRLPQSSGVVTLRYGTKSALATALIKATAGVASVMTLATVAAPAAAADNRRLNDGVVANVYTIQHQHGCTNDVKSNPQLRLAAQWHADDVLDNRALDGDIGSDGSTVQNRAAAAGFKGAVSETVAINPALAISGIEIMNQWFYRSDYMAIMSNCANTQIGVWSLNSLDRSVVVAVYGQPA